MLIRFGLFLTPFLLGIILLFVLPYDPTFAYHSIEQHCRNGHWMYQQMYHSDRNIDIALLGTSRTMCGVSDYTLEKTLNGDRQNKIRVANMGFARPGRNLHYAIAKDLFAHHEPDLIILEVRTYEDWFSHLDFAYIAKSEDIIFAEPIVNQRYIEDVYTAGKMRFLSWRSTLLGEELQFDSADIHRSHSFIPGGPLLYSDSSFLRHIDPKSIPDNFWKKGEYEVHNYFPRSYLKQIAALCQENGTELRFLYLPNCNEQKGQLPLELNFYRDIAPVWIPPDSIVHHIRNYADPDHLNEPGAEQLSHWVSEQINRDSLLSSQLHSEK